MTAYAHERGLTIVETFEDIETAKQSGRSNFGAMTDFLQRAPTCRIVLVEKTDRLYRNIKNWVTMEALDREIHLVKEGVVLSNDSRSSEKFMHGIRVLMAKNYIDNLSEEVRKGLREKAEQGHWPTVAHIGYVNNRETHRIAIDPERGPLVAKLFEWYAAGDVSLKAVTQRAFSAGLTHPRRGRRLTKSEIHRILHNPVYTGDFRWKDQMYRGLHEPLISHELFDAVQDVFAAGNRPKYTKHEHAFAGLLTCGLCGCAMTAEIKKGRYIYYHCAGFRGHCGNTYIREEALSQLFADVVRGIEIPEDVAEGIAQTLRDSQDDKERFHRTAVMRLQQQYLAVEQKLDRAYEDRLAGKISEDLWTRKSVEWETEREAIQRETRQHERASDNYAVTGSRILELAKNSGKLFEKHNPREQAALLKTVLSNCAFERGSLTPTYTKPFDLLVKGNETGNWRRGWDSNSGTTRPVNDLRNDNRPECLKRLDCRELGTF